MTNTRTSLAVSVVETGLAINGLMIDSAVTLAALEAVLGAPSRTYHADVNGQVIFHWIWDDDGLFVTGPSSENVRGFYFRLTGGPTGDNPKAQPRSQFCGSFNWHSIPMTDVSSEIEAAAKHLRKTLLGSTHEKYGTTRYTFDCREESLKGLFGSVNTRKHYLPAWHTILIGDQDDNLFLDFNVGVFFSDSAATKITTSAPEVPVASTQIDSAPHSKPPAPSQPSPTTIVMKDGGYLDEAARESARIHTRWFWGGGWKSILFLVIVLAAVFYFLVASR